MKKIFAGAFVAALMTLGGTVASAATITLEATITGITGSAALLSELGITDGTAKARVTFDADLSSGATLVDISQYKYDYLYSTYSAFSLITPNKTITAVAFNVANHRIFSRDGLEDRSVNSNDVFQVSSNLFSSDPNSYDQMIIQSWDYDETLWSRADPITAGILNAFSTDYFGFTKVVGGQQQGISASNITWAEVAVVPLPAGLPLLLAGLGALGLMRRRRRS